MWRLASNENISPPPLTSFAFTRMIVHRIGKTFSKVSRRFICRRLAIFFSLPRLACTGFFPGAFASAVPPLSPPVRWVDLIFFFLNRTPSLFRLSDFKLHAKFHHNRYGRCFKLFVTWISFHFSISHTYSDLYEGLSFLRLGSIFYRKEIVFRFTPFPLR